MSAYLDCPACGDDAIESAYDGCPACESGEGAEPHACASIPLFFESDDAVCLNCGAALVVRVDSAIATVRLAEGRP